MSEKRLSPGRVNATYMVIFRQKKLFSIKNDLLWPHFRPKLFKIFPNTHDFKLLLFYVQTKEFLLNWNELIVQFLGYTNGSNEARNTNTKFPDQKQWNIVKNWEIFLKAQSDQKRTKRPNFSYSHQKRNHTTHYMLKIL